MTIVDPSVDADSVTRNAPLEDPLLSGLPPVDAPAVPLPSPAKRRGRPPKDGNAPRAPLTKKAALAEGALTNTLLAATLVDMSTSGAALLIGGEWEPQKIDCGNGVVLDERQQLIDAVKIYLDSQGQTDISPGTLLLIALSQYGLRRAIEHENTRSKLGKLTQQITDKAVWLWRKIRV